jgi:hypothetical protein
MASTNSSTKEQEACNSQRVFGVVPLLVRGLATAAQGEVTTEAGMQVLTHDPVTELDRARRVAVNKRSYVP